MCEGSAALTGAVVAQSVLPPQGLSPRTAAAASSCAEAVANVCECHGCRNDAGPTKFVYQYLESNGFPGELFPTDEVTHCGGDELTGHFHIQLRREIERDVDVPGFCGALKFSTELRGIISRGKIKRLRGVTVTTLGIAMALDTVTTTSLCKSKVFFFVGLAFVSVPVQVLRSLWL